MSANDWMRQSRMDILKYLPNFLSKDPMFHCAAETCNEEHDRLRLALQNLADNFFVNTATWALPQTGQTFMPARCMTTFRAAATSVSRKDSWSWRKVSK